jgi:D-glycero-beta-D-manno-heptose-7-phosphate kinase
MSSLSPRQVRQILDRAHHSRILVVGDVMLDHFVWGHVSRISPEAPVPVVEFDRENLMPGGAANVARNLSALGAQVELFGVTGRDTAARQLTTLLNGDRVDCRGLLSLRTRSTTSKTRIIAAQQQVARVDRETAGDLDPATSDRLFHTLRKQLPGADAVIIGDYGKGVVTQPFLDEIRSQCRARGIWVSLDPKPVHPLNLSGLSLITPNRKETFALAGIHEGPRHDTPLADRPLLNAVERLMSSLQPALLLVTLGDHGMLLCQRGEAPRHFPTAARELFDVSGAGDTVIASFTLAITAGASPAQSAVFSNHAARVVVGKVGTAIVLPAELIATFRSRA